MERKKPLPEGYDSWYEIMENAEPKEITKQHFEKVYAFIIDNDRVPTVKEVSKITGLSYFYCANVRRRALKALPKYDMEELGFNVRRLISERIQSGEMDNTSLVRLMPWVAAPLTPSLDVKQDITHRFVVVKPDAPEKSEG